MYSKSNASAGRRAAIFVDFQNLYYLSKNKAQQMLIADDLITCFLGRIDSLLGTEEIQFTTCHVWADFGSFGVHGQYVQRNLYLNGVTPCFIPSGQYRIPADMQIAIDVMDTIYIRPDIDTIILASGDREYVPLIQRLRNSGHNIIGIAFQDEVSEDFTRNAGSYRFVNAITLLDDDFASEIASAEPVKAESSQPVAEFNNVADIAEGLDEKTLSLIEQNFGQYEEIYLTPLLRKLSEIFSEFTDCDPKSIIGNLESSGAIRLEKRRGYPYDYTVLMVNEEHPDVEAIRQKLSESGHQPAAPVSNEGRMLDHSFTQSEEQ